MQPATAFDQAGQVLALLAGQDTGAGLDAWLALTRLAGGLVDGRGHSHLARLIDHDKRLCAVDWTPGLAVPAPYADIARASREAGWQGADGEAILAAALRRGDTRMLDWVAGLGTGIPAFARWRAIHIPVDGAGANDAKAAALPAPCVWAARNDRRTAAALDWWIKRGIPLPERVLDHATPRTLPWLLDAGELVDDAALEAWRARKKPGGGEPLSGQALTEMFDILAKARPAQAGQVGVLAARTASLGRSIIEKASSAFTAYAFDTLFEKWREAGRDEGVPADAWPPLVEAQGGWLLRKAKTPVPWWAQALARCMGTDKGAENLDGLFKHWNEAAGARPRFHPDMDEALREALLGMALWSAWAVAGTHAGGNGGGSPGDYGKVIQRSAAHAHQHVRRVMAWAGLDEAGAGRCLGRALELSARRVRAHSTVAYMVRHGLRALLMECFSNHAQADAGGRVDCRAVAGALEAPALPSGVVGAEHLAIMQLALPDETGRVANARNRAAPEDRLRVAGDLLAAMGGSEEAVNSACARRVVRMLGEGLRPCGDDWPPRWRDSPILQAGMAQIRLQEPAGSGQRRRLA